MSIVIFQENTKQIHLNLLWQKKRIFFREISTSPSYSCLSLINYKYERTDDDWTIKFGDYGVSRVFGMIELNKLLDAIIDIIGCREILSNKHASSFCIKDDATNANNLTFEQIGACGDICLKNSQHIGALITAGLLPKELKQEIEESTDVEIYIGYDM